MFAIGPRPVLSLKRTLHGLASAELFVVSSLRIWAATRGTPTDGAPDWRQCFLRAGICLRGAMNFDRLCRIVFAAAAQPPDIRTLRCEQLGLDEARSLSLLSLLQGKRIPDAETLLTHWCSPAARCAALASAQAFATALASRQLWLSAERCANRQPWHQRLFSRAGTVQ